MWHRLFIVTLSAALLLAGSVQADPVLAWNEELVTLRSH